MSTEISKSKFKARALEIFRQIELSGEPVIVTDRGRPSLVITRYKAGEGDARQRLKGSVLSYEDPFLPVPEEDWEVLA